MIFENTDLKLRTLTDAESVVDVTRTGPFTRSGIDHLDNDHIYRGAENAMEISRIYNIGW